ncbi:hypothetical protein K469DRAFT_691750 [Zopfia rhizophila CBS 207.26]|uniref:Uncharacterized protein n=1 Tax=Zopfia rhizophila CBS 207.26 TaxID=1314779 RepID=A0A6A6DVE7_9PEZI|nr:hypothetical protein K469DRAFT_691750 [Zopfia rhizophila CBS 207.26]
MEEPTRAVMPIAVGDLNKKNPGDSTSDKIEAEQSGAHPPLSERGHERKVKEVEENFRILKEIHLKAIYQNIDAKDPIIRSLVRDEKLSADRITARRRNCHIHERQERKIVTLKKELFEQEEEILELHSSHGQEIHQLKKENQIISGMSSRRARVVSSTSGFREGSRRRQQKVGQAIELFRDLIRVMDEPAIALFASILETTGINISALFALQTEPDHGRQRMFRDVENTLTDFLLAIYLLMTAILIMKNKKKKKKHDSLGRVGSSSSRGRSQTGEKSSLELLLISGAATL